MKPQAHPNQEGRKSEVTQPSKPISAANTTGVPLSNVKLGAIVTAICATALAAVALAGRSTAAVSTKTQTKPTVVLVNGAWANNASWSRVIKRLQDDGYTAVAPPNPLQSLNGDAQTIADFLQTIPGPIVLVGHSYGGMVISNAATGNPNVKALVYIDAFIPDEGESALGLDSSQPGSVLGAGPPNTVFNFVPFPGAAPGDALLYVKPSVFLQGFANDLPAKQGAVLEATQAPVTFGAVTAPSGPSAWKTIPSWALVGTIDNAIPSSIQLFMANRAHAHITKVKAGHLSMISQPDAVTKVILEAAQSVAG
jgi:pimeloyl-ACP methyl ester carboxylesterase